MSRLRWTPLTEDERRRLRRVRRAIGRYEGMPSTLYHRRHARATELPETAIQLSQETAAYRRQRKVKMRRVK